MWEAVQLEIEGRRAFAEKYNIDKLEYATVKILLQAELSVDLKGTVITLQQFLF